MTISFPFNTGCQPLLNRDTCVSVEDDNGDGRSDDITTRFSGEDGHRYELRAQADTSTCVWGPGTDVTLTDLTPDLNCDLTTAAPRVLAHYRVTDNYKLAPLDVGACSSGASAASSADMFFAPAWSAGSTSTRSTAARSVATSGPDSAIAPRPSIGSCGQRVFVAPRCARRHGHPATRLLVSTRAAAEP